MEYYELEWIPCTPVVSRVENTGCSNPARQESSDVGTYDTEFSLNWNKLAMMEVGCDATEGPKKKKASNADQE